MSATAARLAAAFALAALAGIAAASDAPAPAGSFALRLQRLRPAIDREFQATASPYALALGSGGDWMYRLEYARTFGSALGELDLGVGVGYFRAQGHGLFQDPTTGALLESGDDTSLFLLPVTLFAGWRLQALTRLGVPLAPYARLSLERYHWIASGTAQPTITGATNGFGVTLGTALVLDGLDPGGAAALARETGIRRTSLTFDASRSFVDDFGSGRSWDLSSEGWSLGGGFSFAF
jgi:hypothetical protein